MKTIVMYHANCIDGYVAGFCLYFKHRIQSLNMNDIEFVHMQYNDPVPDVKDKDVYIVDFSVTPEQLIKIAEDCNSLVMLDHHISSLDKYANYKNWPDSFITFKPTDIHGIPISSMMNFRFSEKKTGVFDMKRSGARLAFGHIQLMPLSEVNHIKKLNNLFQIVLNVEDRDLWKFEIEDTKAVYELLSTFDYDFQKLWNLISLTDDERNKLIKNAQVRVDMRDELAVQYASKAEPIIIDGVVGVAVNVPANFSSIVGDKLSATNQFALMYVINSNKAFCSLRSSLSSGFDVSKIAEKYNGGGHRCASGFSITPDTLLEILRIK